MNLHKYIPFYLTFCVFMISLSSLSAQEDEKPSGYQYTVKYVCGAGDGKIIAQGNYHTAINIINPVVESANFSKKYSVALPNMPGNVFGPVTSGLKLCQSIEVDCPEIMEITQARRFVKGFVVVESRTPLDIVAVYTASNRRSGVTSIHTERVPARMHGGCPDLVVETIYPPEWDHDNHRTIIRADIRNIGSAPAPSTIARVIDPSTLQPPPSGAPYNAIYTTGTIGVNGVETAVFYLPYWVYNPDAELEVTADYKQTLKECKEDNNSKEFKALG